MPAARDEDWTAIAAQAAAGATLAELAEHWGIPEGTLKTRCAAEGWKRHAREIQAKRGERAELSPQHGTIQPRSTERAVSLMERLNGKSKLRAAKVGDNTLKAIQKKRDDSLIAAAPAFKQTVDALAKVHQWDQQPQSLTQVNINLTGVKLPIRE